jgi:hypothetical protein
MNEKKIREVVELAIKNEYFSEVFKGDKNFLCIVGDRLQTRIKDFKIEVINLYKSAYGDELVCLYCGEKPKVDRKEISVSCGCDYPPVRRIEKYKYELIKNLFGGEE